MSIYKEVKTTPLNKKHVAHKSWTITDETAANYGIVSFSGQYSDGDFSISDPNESNIANEPKTSRNYFKRNIWNSIYHLYYCDVENAYKSNDSEYLSQQVRNINQKLHVVSIPSGIFGDRLKESNVTMSHATHAFLHDDGAGNLIDRNITNLTNFKTLDRDDYIIKVDFNNGWKLIKGNPLVGDVKFRTGSEHLADISSGPFEPFGENITFDIHKAKQFGLATTQIVFKSGASSTGTSTRIAITDASGVTKVYISDGTATGEVSSFASNAVGFESHVLAPNKATNLKAAIDSANGHNGSITTEIITAGGTTDDTVRITQTVAGAAGNTDLVAESGFLGICDVNPNTTPFTGGSTILPLLSGSYGVEDSTFIHFNGKQTINSGSNSFVEIKNTRTLANSARWNSDFAVSFWVKAGVSQSVTSSFTGGYPVGAGILPPVGTYQYRTLKDHDHNVIVTSRQWSHTVPWEINIYNSSSDRKGKLRFLRGKTENFTEITSSAINDNEWHHVVAQIATGSMQLWVDGTLQTSKADPMTDEIVADSTTDIHIGARRWGFKSRQYYGQVEDMKVGASGTLQKVLRNVFQNRAKNYIYPFKGSMDKFKLMRRALTTPEITSLNTYYRDTNIVGNVFYNHGMIAITDMSGSYTNLLNDYTLQFNATTEHTIHNYQCIVEDEQYNITYNPSARVNFDPNNPKLKGFATSSEFTPYITTIGLYNDFNELLAVAKLANPVKSPSDIDIVFNVQFDT